MGKQLKLLNIVAALIFSSAFCLSRSASADCPEYFMENWGYYLDMNSAATGALQDIPPLQVANTTTHTYSGGVLSATTNGIPGLFSFLQYTVIGSIPVGTRYGESHPVDSSRFTRLVFRLYASESTVAQIRWFQRYDRWAITTLNISAGWNTYDVDLASAAVASSYGANVGWTQGNPIGLEIFPANENNVEVRFDWLMLTTASCADLSIDEGLEFTVSQPDKKGGRDFGQTVEGNSWNMDDAEDIGPNYSVASATIYPFNTLTDPLSASYSGDFMSAVNAPSNGDAHYFSVWGTTGIDPSQFVNVCFKGWNDIEDVSFYSSVARVIWRDPRVSNDDAAGRNGDDIVMNRGNKEYCLDMREEIELEPALEAGAPNPWTSIGDAGYTVNYFRVDMNENSEGAASAYTSVIDYITVRTDHESNTQYAIVVSAPLTERVTLYYNTSRTSTGGTMIGTLSPNRSTNVFKWDTSAVAEGLYYIYAVLDHDSSTISRVADGRIKISHSRAQDSTAPILVCERPADGYLFDTTMELAGYALDETRLAAVEVFVDDVYFTKISPNLYHKAAHDAYPTYAEANAPGFQIFPSATALAYGAHTVRIVATDTAGNESSCTAQVTRQNGASTPALTYPTPNGTPLELRVGNPPAPLLKVTSPRGVMNFIITGTAPCTDVTLQGSELEDFSAPLSLVTKRAKSRIKLAVKKVPNLAVPAAGASLYFRAVCEDGSASDVRRFQLSRHKVNKKVATIAEILQYLQAKLPKVRAKSNKKKGR